MISLSHVTLRRQGSERPALIDFSIEIPKGSFTVLCGPSGCGKTSIFHLLTQQLVASEGEVVVQGVRLGRLKGNQLAEYRRSLGIVFQDLKLLSDRTITENLELPLEISDLATQRCATRVKTLLDQFSLGAQANAYPSELSMGERQRVAIARAVASEPFVLLADEPTALLDLNAATEIINLLRRENLRGMTVVLGTNDERIAAMVPEASVVTLGRPIAEASVA